MMGCNDKNNNGNNSAWQANENWKKKEKKAQMVNAIENDFFVGWERERGALKRIDQNLMKLMKC